MRCGSPHKIRTKMGQLWRKKKQRGVNGKAMIFVWHSHKENWDAHAWHSHKDNGDTQDICAAFTQRKVWQFYSEKETKRFGSPHKRGVCMK